jgi:hypothetical protein
MQTLEDLVRATVESFVQNNTLFTALDVSNAVKVTMPEARHKNVRDVVRNLFTTNIEPHGWERSPINVTLLDGTTAQALLYHPLSASWDLDAEYSAQKRSQVSARPQTVVPATIAADGTVTVTQSPIMTAPVVAQAAARDLWSNMFNSQPSLFPRK